MYVFTLSDEGYFQVSREYVSHFVVLVMDVLSFINIVACTEVCSVSSAIVSLVPL